MLFRHGYVLAAGIGLKPLSFLALVNPAQAAAVVPTVPMAVLVLLLAAAAAVVPIVPMAVLVLRLSVELHACHRLPFA